MSKPSNNNIIRRGADTPMPQRGEMPAHHSVGAAPLTTLLALAVAEVLIAGLVPWLGMLLHCAVLVTLLAVSALEPNAPRRRFLLVLALPPLVRVVSLMLPRDLIGPLYSYLFAAVPLYASAALAARRAGMSCREAGLGLAAPGPQIVIALSGLVLGLIEYIILQPAPLVAELSLAKMWFPVLVLFTCTGLLEELIFRGMLQTAALGVLGRWAVPFTAVVFATLHLGGRSLPDLAFILVTSLLLGWVVRLSGSIWGAAAAHGLINIQVYLMLPLLMAGTPDAYSLPPLSFVPTPIGAVVSPSATAVLQTSTVPARSPTVPPSQTPAPTPSATFTSSPTPTPSPSPTNAPSPTTTPSPTATPRQTTAPSRTPTVQLVPSLPHTTPSCADALPSRLQPGEQAVVLGNLSIHSAPGINTKRVTWAPAGSVVALVGGPECVAAAGSAQWWWEIRLANGTSGWSPEGSAISERYYLAPAP